MKSEIVDPLPGKLRAFPKLMTSENGVIILATGISSSSGNLTGMCVAGDELSPIGRMSSGWNARHFTEFSGTVTLSND